MIAILALAPDPFTWRLLAPVNGVASVTRTLIAHLFSICSDKIARDKVDAGRKGPATCTRLSFPFTSRRVNSQQLTCDMFVQVHLQGGF